ncbi:MAG TPA: VOC family protein [Gemmatimonadales bacterium]|nr:VOC family protein [Gemmatimonadales bacterium]
MAAHSDPGYGIAPPGFRLPDDTRLGRVRLQVADLARSLAYYERVLGLRVVERGNGSVTLGDEGGAALVELHERPGARPVPRRGRLGLYHFAILLPDRAALGRFLRHLGEIGERAGMSDHFVSEAIYLTDPDGLGIEVYADRPRRAWRHEGRQLAMSTEPLDVEDLLRAGGGEQWSGMPAGTTLGHVHLFVADLDRAAAFYHGGLGLDKTVWSYPGALFMSAGGYHHHLGTNTWAAGAEPAGADDARLLEWEIVVPTPADAASALASLAATGVAVEPTAAGGVARDPWGTAVRVRAAVTRKRPG